MRGRGGRRLRGSPSLRGRTSAGPRVPVRGVPAGLTPGGQAAGRLPGYSGGAGVGSVREEPWPAASWQPGAPVAPGSAVLQSRGTASRPQGRRGAAESGAGGVDIYTHIPIPISAQLSPCISRTDVYVVRVCAPGAAGRGSTHCSIAAAVPQHQPGERGTATAIPGKGQLTDTAPSCSRWLCGSSPSALDHPGCDL